MEMVLNTEDLEYDHTGTPNYRDIKFHFNA